MRAKIKHLIARQPQACSIISILSPAPRKYKAKRLSGCANFVLRRHFPESNNLRDGRLRPSLKLPLFASQA
jgi:hypothetical protein